VCVNNCEVFQKFFFAISSQHVTEMNIQYGCCYHAIYFVSNCCLSVYVNIAGVRQGPWKNASGVLEKSLEFL